MVKPPLLQKGAKTGSVGKGLPNAMNAGPKRPIMGFPRKPFVCPQKIKDAKSQSDKSGSDSEEERLNA